MLTVGLMAGSHAMAQGGADALPFVRTEFGGEFTGTAGAAVASTGTGAWSAFRNASAMGFGKGLMDAGGEFRIDGDGNLGGSGAVAARLFDNLSAGFGVAYLSSGKVGDFYTTDILVSAALAYRISDMLSLGFNIRYAKQNLTESVSYTGISTDINALAQVTENLSATIGLSALGSKVESASGAQYGQPANIYAGVEYTRDVETGRLALDAMGEYYFSGSFGTAVGASFTYDNMVTIRAGYRYAGEWCVLPSRFAVGLGGRFGGFTIDASLAKTSASYIVSAGIGFSF